MREADFVIPSGIGVQLAGQGHARRRRRLLAPQSGIISLGRGTGSGGQPGPLPPGSQSEDLRQRGSSACLLQGLCFEHVLYPWRHAFLVFITSELATAWFLVSAHFGAARSQAKDDPGTTFPPTNGRVSHKLHGLARHHQDPSFALTSPALGLGFAQDDSVVVAVTFGKPKRIGERPLGSECRRSAQSACGGR